jgi:hypothetical protein
VTAPIPSTEPTNFAAGETVQWTKSVADYRSSDGWSLIYTIRGPTVFANVTATPNADGSYSITIAAVDTAALKAGRYLWASHAYKAGPPVLRYAIERGVILVTANLDTVETIETHAAEVLPIIEAAIKGRLTGDMQQYTIAGRQIMKIPIRELYALRAQYRAELAKERNTKRANPTRAVTFVSPH